jgi:hypothetical protein
MPKFTPTAIIEDCWSSIGNITFYHRNGQCYWKRKPKPIIPGTPAQLNQKLLHHRAILAWQNLQHSTQLLWNQYVKVVPSHRPPYDEPHHISGFNLFVSAYHGYAQLGNEHIPEPRSFPHFPSAALELLEILPDTRAVTLRCRLIIADTTHPERWHLSARIKLTVPGLSLNSGCMRSYIAIPDDNIVINQNTSTRNVTFTIAGSLADGPIQAHIKYRMIDEITGYRNNWKLLLSHQNKDRLLI